MPNNEFIARKGLIALESSQITGSLNVSGGVTGSLLGTASWSTNAISSSLAVQNLFTASVSLNTITFTKGDGTTFPIVVNTGSGGSSSTTLKASSGSANSFSGSPRTASISFGTAFSSDVYSVVVTAEDARAWTIQSKTTTGFVINSNSSVGLTGPVYWIATGFSNS